MLPFETPSQPEKKSIQTLYEEAKEALLADQSIKGGLGEKTMELLLRWQEAAEQEAERKNTSLATIEVIIQRAILFIAADRYDLAKIDVEEALLAAYNDRTFPKSRLRELEEMKRKVGE